MLRQVVLLVACLLAAALAGALAAQLMGPEADFDLRNYHLYNGFALLHGRLDGDLAPAQLQSFLAPDLDLIYAGLLHMLNRHPGWLGAVLALPQGLAGYLVWCLTRRALPEAMPARGWLAGAAALAGVTGAAGVSTFASAMSEMLPASCLLGAMLLLMSGSTRPRAGWAGLLAGCAMGLKLTAAPFAVGLMVAAALTGERGGRRISALLWFVTTSFCGAALLGGAWWEWLWVRFGDPMFPYFNEIFRSPWVAPVPGTDLRFLPRDVWQAVGYPLFWGFTRTTLVNELPVRDPRVALGWVAAFALLGRAWRGRMRPAECVLLSVWIIGYVLWEARFSILRYLVPLELLSGALVVAALAPWLARRPAIQVVPAAWALAAGLIAVTVYPNWGHAPPGHVAVSVHPPAFAPGSLVVLLDPSPMAYVAVFVPPTVRFVGANNNLVRPGAPGRLAHAVAKAIRTQVGPLWGLEEPGESPGVADATLRAFDLVRAPGCARVRSNLDGDAILACPLRRLSRTAGPHAG
ncbi:MAG: hypothetical protein KGL52_04785 [Rhodospirillales bacterium]|nr:hypothetical protein [Rhodospirillales bacterium]